MNYESNRGTFSPNDTDTSYTLLHMKFLDNAMKKNSTIAIFLATGMKLQGKVSTFDSESVALVCPQNRTSMVIFFNHITTISDKETSDITDKAIFI